jgi:hypothetical protein
MANLSGKISEVKLWGRGGCAARHRSPSCAGKQIARRSANRAERKAAKQALMSYADDSIGVSFLMGEDADAHVVAFEAAEDHRHYSCGFGCTICDDEYIPSCTCILCTADNGIISWTSALRIYRSGCRPCDLGLTPEDFGCYGL